MQVPLGGLASDWALCGERDVKGKGIMVGAAHGCAGLWRGV